MNWEQRSLQQLSRAGQAYRHSHLHWPGIYLISADYLQNSTDGDIRIAPPPLAGSGSAGVGPGRSCWMPLQCHHLESGPGYPGWWLLLLKTSRTQRRHSQLQYRFPQQPPADFGREKREGSPPPGHSGLLWGFHSLPLLVLYGLACPYQCLMGGGDRDLEAKKPTSLVCGSGHPYQSTVCGPHCFSLGTCQPCLIQGLKRAAEA